MKTLLFRSTIILTAIVLTLTLGVATPKIAWADDDDPKVSPQKKENRQSSARRRYGANKAKATVEGEEISVLAGRPSISKDTAYPLIDTMKTGDLVTMNLGQAIKFSTPFDCKFGDLLVKAGNVAPDYPGVYSLWMKKTESGWNIVFNGKPDIWGTMHNSAHDIGETAITYKEMSDPKESLILDIEVGNGKGLLTITWGKHQWSAPFTIEL